MHVPIRIVHLHQDDPSKCTAVKLKMAGLAKFTRKLNRGLLLDPFAPVAFSIKDKETIQKEGLVAVDGSWKLVDYAFMKIKWPKDKRRALPLLIAANPTNFGKPFKLSTVEALASALYISGFIQEAMKIMNQFRWGHTFFQLNNDYLEMYAQCKDSSEIIQVQRRIMNADRLIVDFTKFVEFRSNP